MGPRPDFNITPAFKAAVVTAYETWSDNKYLDQEH